MSWALVSKGVLNVAQQELYGSLNHDEWKVNPRRARSLRSTKLSSTERLLKYVNSLVQTPRLANYVRHVSFGQLNSRTAYYQALEGNPYKSVFDALFELLTLRGLNSQNRGEGVLVDLILALCPNIECLTLGTYNHEQLILRYRQAKTNLPCSRFFSNIRTIRVSSDPKNTWGPGFVPSWMADYFNLPGIAAIHQVDLVVGFPESPEEENRSTVQTLTFNNCRTFQNSILDTLSRPKNLRKFVFSYDTNQFNRFLAIPIQVAKLGHALRLQKHSLKDVNLGEYEGFNPRPRPSNRHSQGTVPIFDLTSSVDDEYTINGFLWQLGENICDFSDSTNPPAGNVIIRSEKVGSMVDFDELERLSIPSRWLLGDSETTRYRLCQVLPRSLVHLRLHNLHYWVFVDVKRLLMEMEIWVPRLKSLELVVEEGMKREWGPEYKLAEDGRNLLMVLAEKMGVNLTIDERY